MQDIIVERYTVNIEALDETIRAALGDVVTGVSTRPGAVVIHLTDAASKSQANQARQIALDHDASILTDEQTAEAARIQKLQTARLANRTELDAEGIGTADLTTLKQVARKVAWMEQEIRDLRGEL